MLYITELTCRKYAIKQKLKTTTTGTKLKIPDMRCQTEIISNIYYIKI